MLLEIAICTYNRAADLDRCLEAMSRQHASTGWRVTVIDNASTDATPEVVARHVDRGVLPALSRVFESRPGLTSARQRALRGSECDWLAFVDDDCRLRAGWVAAALAAIRADPEAGAIGGRVLPDWGRPPPPHLARNGWLFAEQDHGDAPCTVGSLVGTGLVLNTRALAQTGWIDAPLLADRIGRGFVSGGDVEISARLAASGRILRYDPALVLDHLIARDRQGMRRVARLAAGLGAGSAMAALLVITDLPAWLETERAEAHAARRRHLRSLGYVASLRYDARDWRIHDAFLAGRQRQLAAIFADPEAYRPLVGALRPSA